MKRNRTSRRKKEREEEKKDLPETEITKKDKLYAFLAIGGLFLATVLLVLWLAFPNLSVLAGNDGAGEKVALIKEEQLPILGNREVTQNGQDTIYHSIPDFSFINQDSIVVTAEAFEEKVYVADFFFTTCTTICPVMKNEMQRVYEEFKDNSNVAFLSHTIDPGHDSIPVLKEYAEDLGIDNGQWHLVTGARDDIFSIAQKHYMVTALEDSTVPDGVLHSGAFILIDQQKRIRGYYDGTDSQEVDRLIKDIPKLLD